MTVRGGEVHGKIRDALRRQKSAEAGLSERLYECEKRIAALVEEREQAYTRIAKSALPELSAESVRNTLHEVQSDVEKIYLERQGRRRALEQEMAEAADRRAAQDARLEELEGRRAAKAEEIAALKTRVVETLRGRPDYAPLRQALSTAQEQFHLVEELRRSFLSRTTAKNQDYEANPVFAYLLRRGYGTAAYRAHPFTRSLDGWAAGKVDFLRQKAAYDILHRGPAILDQELDRRRQAVTGHESNVTAVEREVAAGHGLIGALEDARQLDLQRVAFLEQITRAQEDWNRKSNERADLDNSKGSHHVKALERLKAFLKGEEIASLMARVGGDDAPTVTRISTIDAEIRILKDDSKSIQREQAESARRLRELQEIESHFVSRNYDSAFARFRSGLDIDPFLAGCLAGRFSAFDVCSHLDRYRYVEPTRSSSDSLFSSSSFGGSSSSFGSSSSSSFGSSGSSSGGGGGGGFSTGGGF